jgi:hypothetical protein
MLLKRCRADGNDTLMRSTLACYALLRPAVTVRIKSDVERALARQVEALVLFSILGSLFPQQAAATAAEEATATAAEEATATAAEEATATAAEEATAAATAAEEAAETDDEDCAQPMPAWFFGLGKQLTPEMRVYVDGVLSRWGGWPGTPTAIDKQSSFCRLVMETQCQLHVLVLRRGKCCYSNRFVFPLK